MTLHHPDHTVQIDGSALLATEQALILVAPELISLVQQIRGYGLIRQDAVDAERTTHFDTYIVVLSVSGAKVIREALYWTQEHFGKDMDLLSCLVSTWTRIVLDLELAAGHGNASHEQSQQAFMRPHGGETPDGREIKPGQL